MFMSFMDKVKVYVAAHGLKLKFVKLMPLMSLMHLSASLKDEVTPECISFLSSSYYLNKCTYYLRRFHRRCRLFPHQVQRKQLSRPFVSHSNILKRKNIPKILQQIKTVCTASKSLEPQTRCIGKQSKPLRSFTISMLQQAATLSSIAVFCDISNHGPLLG